MNLDLYVITDETIAAGHTHAEIARLAIAGGADVIQLRDKACGRDILCRIGREIREITRETGTLFIVNDLLDVAISCGADGVHLGQGDMRVDAARRAAPRPFVIGVSVGSVCEAVAAEDGGADYVAVSPVFSTTSKDDAGPGHGLAALREIRAEVSIPVIAIGGISRDNVGAVIRAGADGIAVISAVAGQPDITAAARDLKDRITAAKQECRR
ncbi:MAG: thiamine phosphate synthase [Methanoregula sp.]|uniref:thiamine phosphate synthase n=1 Tax=Methanoregula sp. TaxID=2052170 RepID=UPI003C44B126